MSLVHPQNAAALESLRRKYYFPVLERAYQACRKKHGLPAAADHITVAMRDSQQAIERLIQQRVTAGAINDHHKRESRWPATVFKHWYCGF